jgi:regulator of RNase E activity RraA
MVGCNLGAHIALYKAKPGDILVIDGKGYKDRSLWGGLQSYVALKKGLKATIIDGSIRDRCEHEELGYCVCAKGFTPAGPHKGWADELQVPITCGGVIVNPGDIIVIDNDSIAVIPKQKVESTLEKAQRQIK